MVELSEFISQLEEKNPNQPEFIQAVEEVLESVIPYISNNKKYQDQSILHRLVEPERTIMFRVPWVDDEGKIQVNRGFRVEMNSAIGPYKGGLRFDPSVDLGVLKFLAFEQTFKNSLTTLPIGSGKGGSDFNPKGKSDLEVMRFCQSFMNELYRHIGHHTDIPAGDIGVGAREIGFLFGQYKRLKNEFTGVLTGKALSYGGSKIRTEATGYGLLYFVKCMLEKQDKEINDQQILISGSGNVAQYAAEKAISWGARVLTMSDSDGTIYVKGGITEEMLKTIMEIKNGERGRIKEVTDDFNNIEYKEGAKPWDINCDIALPCATQNEIEERDAKQLVDNGCYLVAEGANMPSTPKAADIFEKNNILFGPGKAANAGGVATSGFEMAQNAMHVNWSAEEVENRLQQVMKEIHDACVKYGQSQDSDEVNYLKGANIAGFVKVADAMIAQGVV